MGRFVERIAHKPSLHHSAYSVRTGQCVSCVVTAAVILFCVRCAGRVLCGRSSLLNFHRIFYVIQVYITAMNGRIHGCVANYVF